MMPTFSNGHFWLAKRPISQCDMGRFTCSFGLFRTLIRTVSPCETHRMAWRNVPNGLLLLLQQVANLGQKHLFL